MISILTRFIVAFSILISCSAFSQSSPFEISINPISVDELGGLQSYAIAQYNGKWLLVGGRLDGLHRRQPWAAFDLAGHNTQLIVVDPIGNQKWSAPLTSLPTSIQEQLSSTNMEFYQEDDYLYCLGGYGYSATAGDHTTFSELTALKVSSVMDAIIGEADFSGFIRQISDPQFQVTGGRLHKIYDTYHLLGGQKFLGRYNPMGPDFGPGFTQEYTNAIRRFTLDDDGTNITITHLTPFVDSENLHRRDYNAEPQILPNGEQAITMYSGVFQETVDLPFLNSVTVDDNDYTVNDLFQQYYNHYHCAVLPLYSESNNEMHTVFFGGIAQYYDNNGTLVQDDNVPFVNTIARVSRNADGVMSEHKLPIVMPALLGAGSEFIHNPNFPHFENGVFKLDSLTTDSVLIGYIFGGISSSEPNIFFINEGNESDANSEIFEVYLKNATPLSIDQLNLSSISSLNLNIYPNPYAELLNISFHLNKKELVTLTVLDSKGSLIHKVIMDETHMGLNEFSEDIPNMETSGTYLIRIETETEIITQKLIYD